jgi:hypothetical protein
MRLGVLLLAVVAGCGDVPNPASCLDNHCSDPDRPYCDKDGSVGGEPNTCISVACTPGEFERCNGDGALKCNATGTNFEQAECEYGCSEEAAGCNACNTPDCERHIIPRYLPNVCNELTSEAGVSFTTQRFDTGADESCTFIVPQTGAPDICVRRGDTFTIPANTTLTLNGTRVYALVADRDIFIEGTIDASGGGYGGGPGNMYSVSGTYTGGAGFRDPGGAGASGSVDGGLANGGSGAPENPSLSTVLVAGRSSTPRSSFGFAPGNGGGGVTIVSCRGSVRVLGVIDANGTGGLSANVDMFSIPPMDTPPTGGGSGGYVALQGMQVIVTGGVFANGSGGGSGQIGGMPAQSGQRSSVPAEGALISGTLGGNGGKGGTGTVAPTVGKRPISGGYAGAGGGSAGFLQIFTAPNAVNNLSNATTSPALEVFANLSTNR